MSLDRSTYDTTSMLLHWSIAILVFSIGLSSPFLDHVTRPSLSTFHNVGGTVALLLGAGWLIWQVRRPAVPKFLGVGVAERAIMEWTIFLMNSLLLLAPASGLILLFAHGGALGVEPFKVAYAIPVSQSGLQRLILLHHILSALLVMLAGGHALHSVWHHVVRRDRLLARMLPGHER